MPEYRISPDQGICPDGHPCTLTPYAGTPGSVLYRTCDTPHDDLWQSPAQTYIGAALVDVYIGPVGIEAYHEAAAALRVLILDHERATVHSRTVGYTCPGVEVCETTAAQRLRALQDAIDPLPREVAP